ncbi:hypothetical protein EUX98_g4777 [Antrodiella citrinella]|uniref:Uncharacterized protein n=1 Tax=Antrodiella citrinella TaxID=2447956 RepID=A0A4S4MT58_9APHY|nr:hypothetical protein EUX98_g4777 [Antrodiella citrinella]
MSSEVAPPSEPSPTTGGKRPRSATRTEAEIRFGGGAILSSDLLAAVEHLTLHPNDPAPGLTLDGGLEEDGGPPAAVISSWPKVPDVVLLESDDTLERYAHTADHFGESAAQQPDHPRYIFQRSNMQRGDYRRLAQGLPRLPREPHVAAPAVTHATPAATTTSAAPTQQLAVDVSMDEASDIPANSNVTELHFESQYRLPGQPEGKPIHIRGDWRTRLETGYKLMDQKSVNGVRHIFVQIIGEWPHEVTAGPTEIADASQKLITSHTFYADVFRHHLRNMLNRQYNKTEKESRFCIDNIHAGEAQSQGYDMLELWQTLEKDDDVGTLVKQQLHETFLAVASTRTVGKPSKKYPTIQGTSQTLKDAIEYAKREAKESLYWKLLGQKCVANACQPDASDLRGKFIAESPEIKQIAVESKACKASQVVVPNDSSWTRINKPPANTDSPVCVILYDDSQLSKDGEITDDAIVGLVVYNAETFTRHASEIDQNGVLLEAQANMQSCQFKDALKRSFHYTGSMTKSAAGTHSTNSVRTNAIPRLTALSAANAPVTHIPAPGNATAEKVHDESGILANQSSLRTAILKNKDIRQLHNFALLEGLSPSLAQKQMAIAKKAKLINRLGAPDTASFASFAYGAPAHNDSDDTVTMGWISSRSPKIQNDESNFFYSDFKVIVQFADNAHWVWNARDHFHGTSLSRLASRSPSAWKTYCKKDPLSGQWSRANVITHAVVNAK